MLRYFHTVVVITNILPLVKVELKIPCWNYTAVEHGSSEVLSYETAKQKCNAAGLEVANFEGEVNFENFQSFIKTYFTGRVSRRQCPTSNGQPCIFPFLYNKISYETCVKNYTSDHVEHRRPWCATSSNYNFETGEGLGYCINPNHCLNEGIFINARFDSAESALVWENGKHVDRLLLKVFPLKGASFGEKECGSLVHSFEDHSNFFVPQPCDSEKELQHFVAGIVCGNRISQKACNSSTSETLIATSPVDDFEESFDEPTTQINEDINSVSDNNDPSFNENNTLVFERTSKSPIETYAEDTPYFLNLSKSTREINSTTATEVEVTSNVETISIRTTYTSIYSNMKKRNAKPFLELSNTTSNLINVTGTERLTSPELTSKEVTSYRRNSSSSLNTSGFEGFSYTSTTIISNVTSNDIHVYKSTKQSLPKVKSTTNSEKTHSMLLFTNTKTSFSVNPVTTTEKRSNNHFMASSETSSDAKATTVFNSNLSEELQSRFTIKGEMTISDKEISNVDTKTIITTFILQEKNSTNQINALSSKTSSQSRVSLIPETSGIGTTTYDIETTLVDETASSKIDIGTTYVETTTTIYTEIFTENTFSPDPQSNAQSTIAADKTFSLTETTISTSLSNDTAQSTLLVVAANVEKTTSSDTRSPLVDYEFDVTTNTVDISTTHQSRNTTNQKSETSSQFQVPMSSETSDINTTTYDIGTTTNDVVTTTYDVGTTTNDSGTTLVDETASSKIDIGTTYVETTTTIYTEIFTENTFSPDPQSNAQSTIAADKTFLLTETTISTSLSNDTAQSTLLVVAANVEKTTSSDTRSPLVDYEFDVTTNTVDISTTHQSRNTTNQKSETSSQFQVPMNSETSDIRKTTYDIGTTAYDASTTAYDASTTSYDIGTTTHDIGTTTNDVGTTAYDVGTTTYDVGTTTYDIGTTANDVDTTTNDVGTTTYDIITTTYGVGTTANDVDTTTNDVGTTTYDIITTTYDVGTTTNDIETTLVDETASSKIDIGTTYAETTTTIYTEIFTENTFSPDPPSNAQSTIATDKTFSLTETTVSTLSSEDTDRSLIVETTNEDKNVTDYVANTTLVVGSTPFTEVETTTDRTNSSETTTFQETTLSDDRLFVWNLEVSTYQFIIFVAVTILTCVGCFVGYSRYSKKSKNHPPKLIRKADFGVNVKMDSRKRKTKSFLDVESSNAYEGYNSQTNKTNLDLARASSILYKPAFSSLQKINEVSSDSDYLTNISRNTEYESFNAPSTSAYESFRSGNKTSKLNEMKNRKKKLKQQQIGIASKFFYGLLLFNRIIRQ